MLFIIEAMANNIGIWLSAKQKPKETSAKRRKWVDQT